MTETQRPNDSSDTAKHRTDGHGRSEPAHVPGAEAVSPDAAAAYWRANLRLLLALLAVWFAVSFGCGILFVEPLNNFRIGEAKLGFWFSQQGAIYVFLALIAVYVVAMNRLDRKHGVRED